MQQQFQLLNDYYDKIYVLSVEIAHARRQSFTERFKDLDYSFFFGADKNKFSITEAESSGIFNENMARTHHRYNKTMKHGEIACSWSHKMIYEDMIANHYHRVLIFEDDAVPDELMVTKIGSILAEVPADCELLMWGWDKNGIAGAGGKFKQLVYHIQHRIGKLKWGHHTIKNLYAKPYSVNVKKAGFHDYTYAYGISRSAAEKLVRMQTPIQYIADNLLAHAATKGILNAFITWPQVFLHDSLPDGTARDSYIR